MSEEEIRNYLSRQQPKTSAAVPRRRVVRRPPPRTPPKQNSYKEFSATHLMCPRCRRAMPVRERVLLYLPDGTLFDYICETCGSSAGTRKA